MLNISIAQVEIKKFKLSEDLFVEEIDEGIFFITHYFPWPGNSLLVQLSEKDFVLCDTPMTPEVTKLLLDWFRSIHGSMNIIAINTHYHVDNLGGNEYLLQQGIPVYGSDLTLKLLNEKGLPSYTFNGLDKPEFKRFYNAYKNLTLFPPDHIFDLNEGMQFLIADETVEIYYPGAGHTEDNVVVYFRNKKLLFGGCLIRSSKSNSLGNVREANIYAWSNSAKNVLDKFGEATIVVPGHGAPGGIELIHHTIRLAKNYFRKNYE